MPKDDDADALPFKGEDLDRAFTRLAGSGLCPMCGSESWLVMQDQRGRLSAIPWSNESGDLYPGGLVVLTVNCARCGFIRQHAIREFRKFMEEEGDAN